MRIARPLLIVLSCLLPVMSDSVAQERAVDLELVLAADVSRSMDAEELALQRQGFVQAIRHPEVVETIRSGPLGRIAITYFEWAGGFYQSMVVDWTEVSDAASAAAFAREIERAPVRAELWTSISSAILYATISFERSPYRGLRRVIDISGDGPNNNGLLVTAARDSAVAEGIVINGLPIVNHRPSPFGYPSLPDLDLYYENCVIGGPGAFVVVANGFTDFARAIRRKMVLEIAGLKPLPSLLRYASERVRPPCNIGEIQLRDWQPGWFDEF